MPNGEFRPLPPSGAKSVARAAEQRRMKARNLATQNGLLVKLRGATPFVSVVYKGFFATVYRFCTKAHCA